MPNSNKIIVVSIIYKVPPKTVQVKARNSVKLEFLSSIQYSEPISSEQYHVERDATKKRAVDVSKRRILEFIVSQKKKTCIVIFCCVVDEKSDCAPTTKPERGAYKFLAELLVHEFEDK